MRRLVLGALALLLAGCATVPAWDRGNLADPAMAFDRPVDARDRHWMEAREGSSGGSGGAGGGCACE